MVMHVSLYVQANRHLDFETSSLALLHPCQGKQRDEPNTGECNWASAPVVTDTMLCALTACHVTCGWDTRLELCIVVPVGNM